MPVSQRFSFFSPKISTENVYIRSDLAQDVFVLDLQIGPVNAPPEEIIQTLADITTLRFG